MRIGVVGSRSFDDEDAWQQMCHALDGFVDPEDDSIVSGGAVGADTLAERYADMNKMTKDILLPDKERYGVPKAYFIRNSLIVEGSDRIHAFFGWEGTTPGTKDTVIKAIKAGIPVQTHYHWRWERPEET